MVIVARGIVAPLVSLIVPVMVPVNDCASSVDGLSRSTTSAAESAIRIRRMAASSRADYSAVALVKSQAPNPKLQPLPNSKSQTKFQNPKIQNRTPNQLQRVPWRPQLGV